MAKAKGKVEVTIAISFKLDELSKSDLLDLIDLEARLRQRNMDVPKVVQDLANEAKTLLSAVQEAEQGRDV